MADEVKLIDAKLLTTNKAQIAKNCARSDAQKALIGRILFMIDNMPTIEAEPDNGWISVDDRLPDATYDCLVWYSCDTAFGKSKSWGIAHCSRGDWYTKYIDGDNIVVLYWLPLPEPPKGE